MIHYRTNRLIYEVLKQGARSPEEICQLLQGQLERHTIYKWLNKRVKEELVTKRKSGTLNTPNRVIYELAEANKEQPEWMHTCRWDRLLNKPSRKEIREYKNTFNRTWKSVFAYLDVLNSEDLLELERLWPEIGEIPVGAAAWLANCGIDKKICLGCLADGRMIRYTIYDKGTNRYYCPECGLESDIVEVLPELKEKPTEQVKELSQSNRRRDKEYRFRSPKH